LTFHQEQITCQTRDFFEKSISYRYDMMMEMWFSRGPARQKSKKAGQIILNFDLEIVWSIFYR
jgi:hypothetical protein